MKLSQQSLSTIESAIQKAVGKYVCGCDQTAVTDIHLQPDQTSGQLTIFNDDDEELANVMIEEWATYDGDDFMENVEPSLKSILCRMKEAGDFEKITILKPYSFVLVDEDKETVAELLLVDDDTILVDEEFAGEINNHNHIRIIGSKQAIPFTSDYLFKVICKSSTGGGSFNC